MKYFKSSILNGFALCLTLAIAFSACKKDDVLDPSISQLKVCNEAPADEILCASNVSSFETTDPAFYASAKFSDITKETEVTFTLSGKETDGSWTSLGSETFRPSQQGSFDDETNFDLSVNFTRPTTTNWIVGEYKIDTKVEVENGPTAEVKFEVQ